MKDEGMLKVPSSKFKVKNTSPNLELGTCNLQLGTFNLYSSFILPQCLKFAFENLARRPLREGGYDADDLRAFEVREMFAAVLDDFAGRQRATFLRDDEGRDLFAVKLV